MSGKESLERDSWGDKAYQMPWPTRGTKDVVHDDSNWLRVEGEEELECPPLLEHHLQELLSGEEMFAADAEVEDGYP